MSNRSKLLTDLPSPLLAVDDPRKVVKVVASDGKTGDQKDLSYTNCKVIGNGSFGIVFQARLLDEPGNPDIAIKKVLQDKRFKVRALSIADDHHVPCSYIPAEPRAANHASRIPSQCSRSESLFLLQRRQGESAPGVAPLVCDAHVASSKKDEVYLNLVLEYVPETVYRASRHYAKLKQPMPMLQIKLYMYQLLRSLMYIHSVGICHRDIKPQNLLLNPSTGVLKLCDFGSAKILVAGEPNVSYICSRYYRAPELIFGATNYTTNIGMYACHSKVLKFS